MAHVSIPLITNLRYNYTSGQTTQELAPRSYLKNCVVSQEDGHPVVEKRPGFYEYINGSGAWEGYGVYYWSNNFASAPVYVIWDGNLALYWANEVKIGNIYATYHGENDTHIAFAEMVSSGSEELLINAHNAGHSYNLYTLDDHYGTITQITNATHGFPSTGSGYFQTPGVVSMDGYCFCAFNNGAIFNSNLNDVYTWSATDFISAERFQDVTKYICKHNNQIAVFGTQSIEFFYNAGNPNGSPLARREDVFYDIGLAQWSYLAKSPAADSNDSLIAFIGAKGYTTSGGEDHNGVYIISNFQLKKISTPDIDKLVNAYTKVKLLDLRDRTLVVCTTKSSTGSYYTYVYDLSTQLWYWWTFKGSSTGFSINGAYSNWFITWDNAEAWYDNSADDTNRFRDGNATDGWNNVSAEIVLDDWDGGAMGNKFIHDLSLIGRYSDSTAADNVSVYWSDDGGETYTTGRNIDQRYMRPLSRGGVTRRRKFKLAHTGNDNISLYRIDLRAENVDSSREQSIG